jgi:predicted nucleotidyltransferase component of viral defense system
MNLHKHPEEFNDLVTITSEYIGIPAGAVKRDYFIVMMLEKLEESKYADSCVFKGGTSLSKCYPESIARFSEDIDLTFIPQDDLGNKKYDKTLKQIEDVMSAGFRLVKIPEERNDRNKSSFIWFDDTDDKNGKIKLERLVDTFISKIEVRNGEAIIYYNAKSNKKEPHPSVRVRFVKWGLRGSNP